jgi:hypothetical protein
MRIIDYAREKLYFFTRRLTFLFSISREGKINSLKIVARNSFFPNLHYNLTRRVEPAPPLRSENLNECENQ